MPYAPKESARGKGLPDDVRELLDPAIKDLKDRIVEAHKKSNYDGAFAGLCNYSFTRIFCGILLDCFDRPRYYHCPLIRGVCKDIGDELYRRVFQHYEDIQIEKNGDITEYLELQDRCK